MNQKKFASKLNEIMDEETQDENNEDDTFEKHDSSRKSPKTTVSANDRHKDDSASTHKQQTSVDNDEEHTIDIRI